MRPSGCDPKARFRSAKRHPDFTIDQNWSAYSPAEHNRWDRLFKRSYATLRNRACDEFLAMMEKLELSQSGIPDMEKLSSRLAKLTGWRVAGFRRALRPARNPNRRRAKRPGIR
jgi:phenylalanine-4-hydroxylase